MTDTALKSTDTDEVQAPRPSVTRWLIIGAAALAALALALALALTILTTTNRENDQTIVVPAADSADAGFARDMAIHHQQAVEMAYIVRDRTADEDVRRLAYDIAQTQANQRGMLLGWLDLWGLPKTSPDGYMTWMQGSDHMSHEATDGSLMPGMATNTELGQLGKLDGKRAEILYLQLMIDHHLGGIDMARACAQQCEVEPEKKLAQGMVEAQQSEVQLMTDLLKERGAAPRK